MFELLTRIFKPHRSIPPDYRSNFWHLFGDIIWYGVLNGSTVQFLSIYAARTGATSEQIGFLGASGALANIIFTLPVMFLFSRRTIPKSVLWSAILNRVFYLVFIFIPMLLAPQVGVWTIIITSLVMSIPLTGILVGFNALFAEAVPQEWRAYVAIVRNALLAFTSLVTTLLCGQILEVFPVEVGYTFVFVIGSLGGGLSTYHLSKINSVESAKDKNMEVTRTSISQKILSLVRVDVLKTKFKKTLIIFFCFHLFQFFVIPIFPIYAVNILKYSDQHISLGFSLFQMMLFLISSQLFRITHRFSNRIIAGVGMICMGEFPLFLPFSQDPIIFLLVVGCSAIGWALVSGTMFNYLLEQMPDTERPVYMSWYNLANNAAVLIGSLSAPFIAQILGFEPALWFFAIGRILVGIAILLLG